MRPTGRAQVVAMAAGECGDANAVSLGDQSRCRSRARGAESRHRSAAPRSAGCSGVANSSADAPSWWRWLFTSGAVIVTLMTASIAGAEADFIDGNALYGLCSKPEGSPMLIDCFAYIRAIVDVMRANGPGAYGLKECAPIGISLGQLIDIVKGYLAAHPEVRTQGASLLVARALSAAFPCSS